MSINEKNANTASEELINIPVNLSADELIEIPANLSNNTSSCQNCEGDICEGCMTTCEVNASCQVGCQNCLGVACQTSCQNSCQTSCQNCEGVACQTTQACTSGCEVTCTSSCEDICETACEVIRQYTCQESCQNCQGVSCQTCQNCEGVVCLTSCQNCQGVSYQACQNCEGAVCLTSCQNCQGVTCQTCQGNCEIESQRPDNWEWVSPVEAGRTVYYINNSPWYLTAEEWNRFTARINQFRNYRGLSAATFTTAVQGQPMLALQANEAINAINAMNPSIAAPNLVSSNDPIMAQFINGLANSLNSLL